MSTVTCQSLALFEGLYLGVEAPPSDATNPKFKLLFTSFVKINDAIHNPIETNFLIGGNLSLKIDQPILMILHPILKVKKLYRLILTLDSYNVGGRHGIYHRLIDLTPIELSQSVLFPYVGEINDINSIISKNTKDIELQPA